MNTTKFISTKLIWYLIICVVLSVNILSQTIHFQKLSTSDGLSNNLVYDIIQDKAGFIWIATDNGLNRFDGYEFKVFRSSISDSNSLSDNSVWALAEDKSRKLWIGSKSGWLNCYDPVKEKFGRWYIASDITKENTITTIFPDDDKIWIGTYRSGLYRFDTATNQFENWRSNHLDSTTLSYNYISSIVKDAEGHILLSTYNGLTKLRKINNKIIFERFYKVDDNPNSLSDNLIWNISIDEEDPNLLWLGTANHLTSYNIIQRKFRRYIIPNKENLQFGTGCGNVITEVYNDQKLLWTNSYAGLLRYNLTTSKVDRFTAEKNNPFSLPSNRINKIYRDKSGVLWIGTDNGLAFFSLKKMKFNYSISPDINLLYSRELYNISINAIAVTHDNTLWIGTEKGLFYSNEAQSNLLKFSELGDANIWSLCADDNDNLWVGTYGSGFYLIIPKTKKLINWTNLNYKTKSPSKYFVKALLADNENIWIGYWGLGLARFNYNKKDFTSFLHNNDDTASLSYDDVWVIHKDTKQRIFIGTNGGGINIYINDKDGFLHLLSDTDPKVKLGSNSIYSICESKAESNNQQTVLWIGTSNGLTKLIINESQENVFPKNVKSKYYTIADGLPDNSIKSLIEDKNGNLWIGTSSGISMLNLITGHFINFNTDDGLISNDINLSAAAILNNNIILMGSKDGLIFFHPDDIRLSYYNPPILFTDLRIFNQPVSVAENSILSRSIIYSNEISIPFSNNVFSISFAAIDYNSPKSIKYAYMLEGFDKDWIYVTDRRSATYTNLYPGKYLFKVKATNSDGVWSDNIKTLKVIILPPWWQSYWAVAIYILVFVLGVWGIVRFQVNREKLRNELKRQEFEAHHLREVEKMKSRFFANLSHEFRTPLMLIKGPLEELITGKIAGSKFEYYQMIKRNADRLQNLIDQLLELSQLESECIPLDKQSQNIVNVIASSIANFLPFAKQKKIQLDFNCEYDSIQIAFDRDKLEKIINNLLNNALKFTKENGRITIDICLSSDDKKPELKLLVSDSGVGIPEEHLDKIFNRFFQVDSTSNKSDGFGIGLALVKELVSLHQWNISVASKTGEGTTFTITIPLTKEEYERITHLNEKSIEEEFNEKITDEEDVFIELEEQEKKEASVLFVDDSEDVRIYVSHILEQDYYLYICDNAKDAIEIAINHSPDLIVSDVMMPEMDGIEFCKIIKTDIRTSHIPVILLTAKAAQDSKIEGLETGADDYIIKPFDKEELLIRIKNLIEQRRLLREKFSKEIFLRPETLVTNTLDKQFINHLTEIVEKNICEFNFDSEKLAQQLAISRSALNRKIKAITGKGPGEFIRDVRMKKAAQMIIENKFNITQIALEIGFASPAQFTKAFKKHFGCLPSEFRENCFNNKTNI
ncbi:two-component regulator propeller domain-containing protein [Ignavibacterium sp.]|uniref:two-component regulator propeller domain-containing protein n=1 Tax=Ignavibacterium sp. TaxID=2651167 RepID=UPI00307E7DEF